MSIIHTIDQLQEQWLSPRVVTYRGEVMPFKLRCRFVGSSASSSDMEELGAALPQDLVQFWQKAASARLFEDAQFSQWGLEILDPSTAKQVTQEQMRSRSTDFLKGDLIIGRFLGDSELLLIRCDAGAPDFGIVLVAAPLDSRLDWPIAGRSLGRFLEQYGLAQGDKYWEHQS